MAGRTWFASHWFPGRRRPEIRDPVIIRLIAEDRLMILHKRYRGRGTKVDYYLKTRR